MTAQEIFDKIQGLGGRLEARGDRLHVEAPKGALGPEHHEALATLKLELLALLKPKVCFHCAGLRTCACISCNTGLALEHGNLTVKPGPCVACVWATR